MAYDSLKAEIRQYIKTNGQNEITGQILQDVLIDMVNNYPLLDGYLHPTINNLGTGDIIQFNGSAWVNTPLSSALSAYATQSWVESLLNGYATQSWVSSNFLPLDGGGTIYNDDYWLGIFGNELLFKYNGTTYGSISLDYGPDGPEFDISSNATLGGATIATQTWVGQNYMPNSTAIINGVTGDDLGRLTLTGNNFTTTILDLTHQHRFEELIDVPTTIQDYGITDAYISSGTIYLGGNSITPMPTDGYGYSTTYGDCFTLSWGATIQYRLGVNFGCDQTNGTYIEFFTRNGQFTGTKIENGQITSAAFVVPNGTSLQFLKADGSLDSNAYITSAALSGYATQSWVGQNFLPLDGGGTVYDGDYYLGIFGNELLFKYNGTTYGSISLYYGPDGPEFDISGNATLGGATIATQTWVGQNYMPNSTAVINGVTGDDLGHLTLTGNNFTTTILDLTHQHRFEELIDVPTTIQDYGIIDAYISNGTIYLGENSITPMPTDGYGYGTTYGDCFSLSWGATIQYRLGVNFGCDQTNGTYIEFFTRNGQFTGTKIENGQITSAAFVVPNGTSLQFLKADGSLDSNAYITSAALSGYATQSWVGQNFLPLDGGGTVYDGDYYLGIFGNELLFKYNGTTYGSISLNYGPDGPEFDISGNATLGGATIATQNWVSSNYATQSTVNGLSYINGLALNADGNINVTGNNFTTTVLDLTHQHRWEDLVDRPAIDMWNDTMISVGGIVSSGKIGAGVSSAPSYMLEVNGQTMLYYNVGIGTSPASGYSLDIDGSARASSFVNNSDIRKKDVIEYDVAPGFEEVVNAPTIRFTWKQPGRMSNKGECVGSIAQYWRNAIPEAVMEDADGYLSMQYDVIALLSAVSVAKKVADNEQRIATLEQENALLRMELKALKAS